MKVAFIVGARPQFIKFNPLVKKIEKKFKYIIIHTGQHYDKNMSPVFFKELGIPQPTYNLGIGSKDEATQLGEMIIKISAVLEKEKCTLAVVFGDTTSTLAGALAANKLKINIAHIEAGMRSYTDMPEEANRVLTDHMSKYLFCSTKTAVDNLKKENITKNVFLVGDLMYDNLLEVIKRKSYSKIMEELNLKNEEYYLLTVHRAENTDDFKKLNNILTACNLAKKKIIFPIHPRTKKTLIRNEKDTADYENIHFIDPLGFLDMIEVLKNAKKVLTDSGGLQKEAYLLNVPCITLRDETEWVELVRSGWNILTGANKEKIKKAILKFNPKTKRENFYGNGKSAEKIVELLKKILK